MSSICEGKRGVIQNRYIINNLENGANTRARMWWYELTTHHNMVDIVFTTLTLLVSNCMLSSEELVVLEWWM